MSETINFELNGTPLTVPKGWTVMQAAKEHGVHIPHFCWHPGLTVAGVCRFCMVKVEGRPKLEIACNLAVVEGMKVSSVDPEVKDAHKWGLEYHLINHPLDCPICDQAGECELQNFYMTDGKYHSQMERPKVLKPKALDVGTDLVLDTERCILCSRCVRFEEEVTKTGALGIFDRGDRAIIGTYGDEKIKHLYQDNLVDVCPVGAFTSKDFRFRQRVWFLQEKKAICPGCSTGCHIEVHGKEETKEFFRIKPRYSEINDHWMCDIGRKTYKHLGRNKRQAAAWWPEEGRRTRGTSGQAIQWLAEQLNGNRPEDVALLVAPQYTVEEFDHLFRFFSEYGIKKAFIWREPTEDAEAFDGLLLRGDRNPNTRGLQAMMDKHGIAKAGTLEELVQTKPAMTIALAPEILDGFPSFDDQFAKLEGLPGLSLWTSHLKLGNRGTVPHVLPMKTFAEKRGTFLNFEGKEGHLDDPYAPVAAEARDVTEVVSILADFINQES